MRFLGIGKWNDLGAIYLQLIAEGHDVAVHVADEGSHDILQGAVRRVDDWRDHLAWIREVGTEGVILFETASQGLIQDELRRDHYQVIGGSAFGDRLEEDRDFGQGILDGAGLQTVPRWNFPDSASAMSFVRSHPDRYVVKYHGPLQLICTTFAGRSSSGEDVLIYLESRRDRCSCPLMLMKHVEGVEMGIGAYFNGTRFLDPPCLDWEHKRFFVGDIGEMTGEMGTLVTYDHGKQLFERTLGHLTTELSSSGYVGYINLNTIVNEHGIWPLEFTSRFGYPGSVILGELQPEGWSDLMRRMLDPQSSRFAATHGYALGVLITAPPFPYHYGYDQLSKGMPIGFSADLDASDRRHIHLGEVSMADGQIACAGQIGSIMTVCGQGPTAADARTAAYGRVEGVILPNMRYRTDIGLGFVERDQDRLRAWGHLA